MGLFDRKPRGMTPAEEAARRRGAHIPEGVARPETTRAARRPLPNPAAPRYETKELKLSQLGFLSARTDVEKKLAPYIADGWEVVSKDIKKYGTGGKHTILLRRAKV